MDSSQRRPRAFPKEDKALRYDEIIKKLTDSRDLAKVIRHVDVFLDEIENVSFEEACACVGVQPTELLKQCDNLVERAFEIVKKMYFERILNGCGMEKVFFAAICANKPELLKIVMEIGVPLASRNVGANSPAQSGLEQACCRSNYYIAWILYRAMVQTKSNTSHETSAMRCNRRNDIEIFAYLMAPDNYLQVLTQKRTLRIHKEP